MYNSQWCILHLFTQDRLFKLKLEVHLSLYITHLIIFYYIYITPVNNLPLGATKPQRFTNIYNEQYN